MAQPIVFFASAAMRQACLPALRSLAAAADLRGPGAGDIADAADAVVLVSRESVDPRLFAGRVLVAALRGDDPAAGEIAMATEVGVLLVRALEPAAMVGQLRDILAGRVPDGAINPDAAARLRRLLAELPPETGGSAGPEPTRYGDWQHKGRVTDF